MLGNDDNELNFEWVIKTVSHLVVHLGKGCLELSCPILCQILPRLAEFWQQHLSKQFFEHTDFMSTVPRSITR